MSIKYDMTGFYNFREGGGMAAGDGRVRTGRLLRCDFPESLDAEDVEFLRAVPVACVIDLRSEEEVVAAPHLFQEAGFDVVKRPIFAGSITSMLSATPTVEGMYMAMLKHSSKQLAGAVSDVAQFVPHGGAVVHCTAGKDRTGVVVALIQEVIGVSDADIVANYVLTQHNLQGQWLDIKLAQAKKMADKVPGGSHVNFDKFIPLMTNSPADAIEAVLSSVRASSGSVEGFLLEHGVSADEISALKQHLVEG